MNKLTHAAAKTVFSGVVDYAIGQVNKNPEEAYEKIIDTAEKHMKDFQTGVNWDYLRRVACNPEYTLNRYVTSIVKDLHPNVLKTTLMNLGFEALYNGTKTIREMRKIHNCNIPWIILMDPTSACNLKCTGCWAAEYGHQLQLTNEQLDKIITEAKELGIHFFVLTGGEPLVRKKDILMLAEKHNDCAFHIFTNGTLIDEPFCKEVQRLGNLSFAISVEGYEETNDDRRGQGVFQKVMNAMDLMKEYGLLYGTSICYTSKNYKVVTSDEFLQMLVDKGAILSWFFHYMPVGKDASVDLLLSPEQREYMVHRVRFIRSRKCPIKLFTLDFQNDAEFVGGCIAGGKNYLHINPNGDVEPCVFIHYSNINIKEHSLLECLQQPLFMEYHNTMPFNDNQLRPCPMLENPEMIKKMVEASGAHSTDMQAEEPVDDLIAKTIPYAENWKPMADKLWQERQDEIAEIKRERVEKYGE